MQRFAEEENVEPVEEKPKSRMATFGKAGLKAPLTRQEMLQKQKAAKDMKRQLELTNKQKPTAPKTDAVFPQFSQANSRTFNLKETGLKPPSTAKFASNNVTYKKTPTNKDSKIQSLNLKPPSTNLSNRNIKKDSHVQEPSKAKTKPSFMTSKPLNNKMKPLAAIKKPEQAHLAGRIPNRVVESKLTKPAPLQNTGRQLKAPSKLAGPTKSTGIPNKFGLKTKQEIKETQKTKDETELTFNSHIGYDLLELYKGEERTNSSVTGEVSEHHVTRSTSAKTEDSSSETGQVSEDQVASGRNTKQEDRCSENDQVSKTDTEACSQRNIMENIPKTETEACLQRNVPDHIPKTETEAYPQPVSLFKVPMLDHVKGIAAQRRSVSRASNMTRRMGSRSEMPQLESISESIECSSSLKDFNRRRSMRIARNSVLSSTENLFDVRVSLCGDSPDFPGNYSTFDASKFDDLFLEQVPEAPPTPQRRSTRTKKVSLLYTPPHNGRASTVRQSVLKGDLMNFSPDVVD